MDLTISQCLAKASSHLHENYPIYNGKLHHSCNLQPGLSKSESGIDGPSSAECLPDALFLFE